MWLVRVETAAVAAKKGSQAKPAKTKFIPLAVGKTYKLGRGAENDVSVDNQSVSKSAGRIVMGNWEDKLSKQGKVPEVLIEYHNEAQIAGSKLSLAQVEKDESKQKPVTVLHPHEGTPRDAEGKISANVTDADYQELNEWGKIEIEDGTIVQLTKSSKLTFTWRPYVFADTDQTAAKIELAQKLRMWGISHHKKIVPGLSSHVVVPEITVSSDPCLEAVSSALHVVRSDFLDQLSAALQSVSPEDGVLLPTETTFQPTVSKLDAQGNKIKDARADPRWWEANPSRRRIWEGTTVLVLGGPKKSTEDSFVRNGGGPVHTLDVATRPPRNSEDFKKKIKPFFTTAKALHDEIKEALIGPGGVQEGQEWTRPPMVILYREEFFPSIQEKWEGEEGTVDVFIETPKSMDIPVEFLQNWWMGLTKPDCMTIFEENEEVSTQLTNRPSATQLSEQPPARVLRRADTEIPSTHPDEVDSQPVSQESTEPAPPAGRMPLKRRAGANKKFSLFGESSSEDDAPPAKRTRTQAQAPSALPSQMPSTGASASGVPDSDKAATSSYQPRNGLKRRAGTLSTNTFFDFDDSRHEDDEAVTSTNDPLAKYRILYDSNKNKSGVPDSMPPDGMDYEEMYTQAKSQARATAGTASQMDVDSGRDDDDDGFLAHLKRKTAAEKKQKKARAAVPDIAEEDEDEEEEEAEVNSTLTAARSGSAQPGTAAPNQGEFQLTQKTLPTLPENVSKDETFLKAANKVKRGSNKIDEFDMEFNALKISKPTKANPVNAPTIVNRVRQTDEDLSRLLEDMDTSTTGNFIVIERMNLYRKDKDAVEAAGPDPAWAGKKNFKKFKKQHVTRQPPVPMILKSTVDYGLGKTYWVNEGAAAPTAEPPTQSQAPAPTQSQARTTASGSQTQASQPMAKGKRKLLAADSDDDDIPVRPVRRTGRTQTSQTPEPTPSATATRTRRGRTTTPSEAEDIPPSKPTRGRKKAVTAIPPIFEDDEEEPEIQMISPSEPTTSAGTRRGTRSGGSRATSILGESTQAEDYIMPLRGSSTVAPPTSTAAASGTGTGRANRKRMILASDDDDLPIMAKKRKKH